METNPASPHLPLDGEVVPPELDGGGIGRGSEGAAVPVPVGVALLRAYDMKVNMVKILMHQW